MVRPNPAPSLKPLSSDDYLDAFGELQPSPENIAKWKEISEDPQNPEWRKLVMLLERATVTFLEDEYGIVIEHLSDQRALRQAAESALHQSIAYGLRTDERKEAGILPMLEASAQFLQNALGISKADVSINTFQIGQQFGGYIRREFLRAHHELPPL